MEETAQDLLVNKRVVYRVRDIFHNVGSVVHEPMVRGRQPVFTLDDLKYFETILNNNPDMYLDELKQEMEAVVGRPLSQSMIYRALQRLNFTHKSVSIFPVILSYNQFLNILLKLCRPAAERSKFLRAEFRLRMAQYTPAQMVFADESGCNRRTASRAWGWAERGRRAQKHVISVRDKHWTVVVAIHIGGVLAYSIQDGSTNAEDFNEFVLEELVSTKFTFFVFRICRILNFIIRYRS